MQHLILISILASGLTVIPASAADVRTLAFDLPATAVKYVRRIEELIGCPVALLSTSPEREDTILVRDPFTD